MRTVDIHAHWYPEEWLALFAKDGGREGASLERKTGGGFMLRAKHITNAFDERFVVVDERVKAMDQRRIDVHALSLTTPMVYWASSAFGLALSQAFNDAASAAHRKHPQRLLGLAMVPMQAPDLAVRELERASKLPGIKGMYLAAKVRPELNPMKQPPSAYLRRFTYDTIGHDDRIDAALVRLVGADRVTLGSDYCFDMGLDDPLATVNRIAGLSAEDKERICGGNARKLLRL